MQKMMNDELFIKKALLDTQERVRDYMKYSEQTNDSALKSCFRDFAKTEGEHAQTLQTFISKLQ